MSAIYKIASGVSILLVFIPSVSRAAGFQVQEQNVTNMGTAYAGTGSLAEDASAGFYNVASITHIKNQNFTVSAVGVLADAELNASFAQSTIGTTLGGDVTRPGGLSVVPSLHYVKRLSPSWFFGFNIASPFGLKTEYPTDSIARYSATRSELQTIDVSPSLAFRISDHWSVGAGFEAVYAHARLNQRIGTGTVATDGFIKNSADDMNYGYRIGLLWDLDEKTRIGAQYRAHVNITASGQMVEKEMTTGLMHSRDVAAKVTLPESVVLSAYHKFDDDWSIMSDVVWTDWSRFRTLRIDFGDGRYVTVPENWRNTYRVSLGFAYHQSDKWLFRFGVAYDESPVQDEFRTARIPDSDRYWMGVGARYQITKNLRLDLGYDHLMFRDATLNESAPPGSTTTLQSLVGTFETSAHIFGLQLGWDAA